MREIADRSFTYYSCKRGRFLNGFSSIAVFWKGICKNKYVKWKLFFTWLKNSSSYTQCDATILSRLSHEPNNLMMWSVNDLIIVDCNYFVTAEQSTVQICCSARYYVTNRYLYFDLKRYIKLIHLILNCNWNKNT